MAEQATSNQKVEEAGTQQTAVQTETVTVKTDSQAAAKTKIDESATLKAELEKAKAEAKQFKEAGLIAKEKYKKLKERVTAGEDYSDLDNEDKNEELVNTVKELKLSMEQVLPKAMQALKENEELKATLIAKQTSTNASQGNNQQKASPEETFSFDSGTKKLLEFAAAKQGKTLEQFVKENASSLRGK